MSEESQGDIELWPSGSLHSLESERPSLDSLGVFALSLYAESLPSHVFHTRLGGSHLTPTGTDSQFVRMTLYGWSYTFHREILVLLCNRSGRWFWCYMGHIIELKGQYPAIISHLNNHNLSRDKRFALTSIFISLWLYEPVFLTFFGDLEW